jgi:hypothetical protein
MELKCICIDDTFRPNEVPLNRWVKKGEPYTIIQMDYLNNQNRIIGVKLAEINNDDLFPYQFFKGSRFAVSENDLIEMNIESVDISDIEEQLS